MTAIHATAYPRIRSNLSDQVLEELYTPTPDDLAFLHRATQSPVTAFGGVVLLKTFQRLGYFPHFDGLPPRLIHHLATVLGVLLPHEALQHYEQRRLREWHIPQIRAHCGITAFSDGGRWQRPFTCPILSACGTSRLVPAWPRPHRLDSGRSVCDACDSKEKCTALILWIGVGDPPHRAPVELRMACRDARARVRRSRLAV
jgi:Domain of unknown function (DUF4158)